MRRFNPYNNIYYFFRGPNQKDSLTNKQLEDNTTKALLNTLLNSEVAVLNTFLSSLKIKADLTQKVLYDMQIAHKFGRYDGAIRIGDRIIYFESKVACELDKSQLINHLKSCGPDYLVVITARPTDMFIVDSLKCKNTRFITWQQLYNLFYPFVIKPVLAKNHIFVNEFVKYLELINMSDFNGFNQGDFEAFTYIEDDPQKLLRLRVKDKFTKYISAIKESLKKDPSFSKLVVDIGNVKKGDKSIFGVLCTPPVANKVHKAHFSFWINPDLISICVQVEGKTPAIKLRKKIQGSKNEFISICKGMEGFTLHLKERVNQDRPKVFKSFDVARIRLGNDFTMKDVNYIIAKSTAIHLPEFSIRKIYKRDDPVLDSEKFISESIDIMKKLKPFYLFAS